MKKIKNLKVAAIITIACMLFSTLLGISALADVVEPEMTIATIDNTATDNYEAIVYDEVKNPETKHYGKWKAGQNTVYHLSDSTIFTLESSANTNFPSSDPQAGQPRPTSIDAIYKQATGSGINIQSGRLHFDKGFGVHPISTKYVDLNALGSFELTENKVSYTIVNLADYTDPAGTQKCDTLYACVGATSKNQKPMYFMVYGDKGDGHGFVKLACSNLLTMGAIGEFNVNVADVDRVALIVVADDGNSNCGSVWGDISIFKADPTAVKPDYTVAPETDDYFDDEGDETEGNETEDNIFSNDNKTTETESAPAETTAEQTEAAEEGGCSSSIAGFAGMALVTSVIGAATLVKKRKD